MCLKIKFNNNNNNNKIKKAKNVMHFKGELTGTDTYPTGLASNQRISCNMSPLREMKRKYDNINKTLFIIIY